MLVFSGVVSAKAMNAVGGDGWGVILVGLVVALAAGLAWGLLNGFLVAKAKIPPRSSSRSARWAWRSAPAC